MKCEDCGRYGLEDELETSAHDAEEACYLGVRTPYWHREGYGCRRKSA